tara:strand:- start:494 stop:724 length:231 start_codon:yes stop_codon:yes gene_type:complete
MKEEEESNQVARVFENMGADKESAQRMAGQLIKRAEQKAEENKTTKIIELQKLLELSIYGAQGLLKPEENGDLEGK